MTQKPYESFSLKGEVEIDGWKFCAFMEYVDKDGGDAYVIAPDGQRAGIVWGGESFPNKAIIEPEDDQDRWGVHSLKFKLPMKNLEDLRKNFESALPYLKEVHNRASSRPR